MYERYERFFTVKKLTWMNVFMFCVNKNVQNVLRERYERSSVGDSGFMKNTRKYVLIFI